MKPLIIRSAKELITSTEQTRAGFIEAALAKNEKARPYIEQAKTLRAYASTISSPNQLLELTEIRDALLTAAGLSDKAFKYFTDDDKIEAIKALIKNFLEPAGENFIDELTYRYLLIKGATLDGSMRNYVGMVAQTKLVRKLLSILSIKDIPYSTLLKNNRKKWHKSSYESDFFNTPEIKGVSWSINGNDRILLFNIKLAIVNNNIDICLFDGSLSDYDNGNIAKQGERIIMCGELKGGIDPAGADEHWKTGNSALTRIRTAFKNNDLPIATSFIAAAIQAKMAKEIFNQLMDSTLTCGINLTVDKQLTEYCDWVIKL